MAHPKQTGAIESSHSTLRLTRADRNRTQFLAVSGRFMRQILAMLPE